MQVVLDEITVEQFELTCTNIAGVAIFLYEYYLQNGSTNNINPKDFLPKELAGYPRHIVITRIEEITTELNLIRRANRQKEEIKPDTKLDLDHHPMAEVIQAINNIETRYESCNETIS